MYKAHDVMPDIGAFKKISKHTCELPFQNINLSVDLPKLGTW